MRPPLRTVRTSWTRALRQRHAGLLGLLALASLAMTASAASTATPANTALPVITGTAQEGHSLTAQSGSWSGTSPIVFSYQWRRCDSAGANCADITAATKQTYPLVAADVGHPRHLGDSHQCRGNREGALQPERGRAAPRAHRSTPPHPRSPAPPASAKP